MSQPTDEKKANLEREQNELRHMINEGLTFDVEVSYKRRRPGFWGYLRRREVIKEKRAFKVQEPTLATLDRLSALWIQMEIDETKLNDRDYLDTAKALAKKEARRMAEVVAVAVLGEDLYITTERRGVFSYKPDEAKLQRLANTFYHAIKPSELLTLAILITNVSNLGDFISSTRLMSATRTSDPMTNRVEQPA
jgi:hypothetical protein